MLQTKPAEFGPLYDELLLWTRDRLAAILREVSARRHWAPAAIAAWRAGAAEAVRTAAREAAAQSRLVRQALAGEMPDSYTAFECGWELDPEAEPPPRSRLTCPARWTEADRAEVRRVVKALGSWPGLGDPPPPGDVELGPVRLQHPVRRGPAVVGYVDIHAAFSACRLGVAGVTDYEEDMEYREERWVLDCAARWRGALPTREQLRLPSWTTTVGSPEENPQTACFLVRPEIPSLAQLLREISTLAVYESGIYLVVSPDDRFADVLREQGVTLVPFRVGTAHALS